MLLDYKQVSLRDQVCGLTAIKFVADEVLEHVDLAEYIASNVFSLEEFEELHGENMHGPLGVLDDVLSYILRYICLLS